MTLLARAPFLAILAALVTAMGCGEKAEPLLPPTLAVLVSAGVLLCTFQGEVRGQWPLFLFVLFLTFSVSLRVVCVLHRPPSVPLHLQTEGIITGVRPWGRMYAAVLETPEGRFLLRLPFATVTEGTRLSVEGVPRPLRGANGKGFDEERFWRGYGVLAGFSASRLEPDPEQPWSFHRLRHELSRLLSIHTPALTGAYLRAAWTGHRDASLNEAHRTWGTSHLLAVSGFHVGIVVLSASFLLRRGRLRFLVLSLLLWGYVLLTGAAPSALRAGIMIQAALAAELLGRPQSSVNSVAIAAVGLLLHSPYLFWNVGWRLSVLAALLIAALHEGGRLKGVRFWMLLSPMIWIVSFPQSAQTFGDVPLVGALLNLFAPLFFSFALSLASAAVLLHLMGVPLTSWILEAIEGAFSLWEFLANGLALLIPWSVSWGFLLAWCGAGLLFLVLCRAMRLSWLRTGLVTLVGSLSSFLIFL